MQYLLLLELSQKVIFTTHPREKALQFTKQYKAISYMGVMTILICTIVPTSETGKTTKIYKPH